MQGLGLSRRAGRSTPGRRLGGRRPAGRKWVTFLRYDVRLEVAWLKKHLDPKFTEQEVERFRKMDDRGIIKNIYVIAGLAAESQVKREHSS